MDVVDVAEQLTAFAALARTADEAPDVVFDHADGSERCGACRAGLARGDRYLPVLDLDDPGPYPQFSIVCALCASRKGLC